MRTRFAALLTAAATLAALVGITTGPVSAQTPGSQPFSGYASATPIGLNALGIANTITANVQAAHSAGSVNSQGLGTPVVDELGQNVSPALPGQNAYGRGSGAEVGVLTGAIQGVDINQIILARLAEASAPPPSDLVLTNLPIDLSPLLSATTTQGEAQALYDPNVCTIGRPLTYGASFVENLQLVGSPGSSQIATSNVGDNVSSSRTVTYLIPNGDGTFGMVSETRMHIAPIGIGTPVLGIAPLSIEVAGEFIFRAIATGKPGGARIEYPGTPVLTIRAAGVPLISLSLQSLLGTNGLALPVPGIATVTLGTPPHTIGGAVTSAPQIAADGTSAGGAVDAVRLSLGVLGLNIADLRVGHAEARAQVPAGGLVCNLPISKSSDPDPVTAGSNFTITVRIPEDLEDFEELFGCDLVNIRAVDVHTVESGNASFVLTGASNGGVVSSDGSTVTFENVGDYRIGDPPIELQIFGRIPGNSGAGVLRDTVTVDAQLGDCDTDVTGGQDIVGNIIGTLTNTAVSGSVTLVGPEITRGGVLAATGGDQRLLLVGGLLLLGAFGLRRRLSKSTANG